MRWRLVCCGLFVVAAAAGLGLLFEPAPASGAAQELRRADLLESTQQALPRQDAGWQPTLLPSSRRALPGERPRPTWFRMRFDLASAPDSSWAILLPYLYGGGEVWLDGELLGELPVSSDRVHVRWERPHLLVVPRRLLRTGSHELAVHAAPVDGETLLNLPAPRVGPLQELQVRYDRRVFWVHTMPELTVAGCLVVAIFVLLIWGRLPREVLYGWFGVATTMWGIRTLTFVMETVPTERWPWWRLVYLASTGGFIVVMALFAARLAGLRSRWAEGGLLAYWALGPAWFLLQGQGSDAEVNRLWTAGLIPIGVATVAVSCVAVWRQRSIASLGLPLALAVATLSGVHDYLVAWRPEALEPWVPGWAGQRYFLLHHGANFLLVAMGVLLSSRFVRSIRALRELNETLESRVADRERELAGHFTRLAELERQNAAASERKLIMREIHDGLGSKLFTSLARVERGAMDAGQMAASLRACISDMRLALDALAPDDHDLLIAFGDFMFRWQAELQAAGVRCEWSMDVQAEELHLAPHATLQVLRVAQEALTNVAKHAKAGRVELSLCERQGGLCLRIADDGDGGANDGADTSDGDSRGPAVAVAGRGIRNMRARAEQLGGRLTLEQGHDRGTVVTLTLPFERAPDTPRPQPLG